MIYIKIFGEISEQNEVNSKYVAEILEQNKNQEVTVLINSPGGDVFEGLAIYNLLKAHNGVVNTEVYGIAASAASIIFMGGINRRISPYAMLLIHKTSYLAGGNSDDFEKEAENLKNIDNQLLAIYTAVTKNSEETIRELMNSGKFIDAKTAINYNFATALINKPKNQIVMTYKNLTDEELQAYIEDLQTQIDSLKSQNLALETELKELKVKLDAIYMKETETLVAEGVIAQEDKEYVASLLANDYDRAIKILRNPHKLVNLINSTNVDVNELKNKWKQGKITTDEYYKLKYQKIN